MNAKYQYCKELVLFKNHIEKTLTNAWDEEDNGNNEPIEKLHNEPIVISFGGQTLELAFGATEYESIIECLEKIIEEA